MVSEAIPRPLAWAGIEARLWSWGTGRGHGGISHNPVGVESVAPGKPKVARASQPLGCGPKSLWDLKAAGGAAAGRVGTGVQFGRWLPTAASDNSEAAGLGRR